MYEIQTYDRLFLLTHHKAKKGLNKLFLCLYIFSHVSISLTVIVSLQVVLCFYETECPGFGWDRINFLPGSWYGAVVWIQDKNNVGNTLRVLLLLGSTH